MRLRRQFRLFFGLSFAFLTASCFAENAKLAQLPESGATKAGGGSNDAIKSARDVHDRVDKRYQGDDGSWKMTMILTNRRGGKRVSRLVRYRKKENGLYRTLLSYVSPADIRGTTTLTIEQEGEDDLQRLYLPAMKKHRRIASQDKGKPWAGTDFSYEDLQEQDLDDFAYTGLSSEMVDGHDCYHYFATPKTPDKSSYGKIENWIRKDNWEPVKGRYYDKKGRLLKELKFLKLRKIQGIWTSLRWVMENFKEKHKTEFIVSRVRYNAKLKERMFTPRSMSRVPEDFKGETIRGAKSSK